MDSDVSYLWRSDISPNRFSEDAKQKLARLVDFVEFECIPAEKVYHAQIELDPKKRWKVIPPVLEELKAKARSLGLWNLFLSKAHYPESVHTLLILLADALIDPPSQRRCRSHQPRIRRYGRGDGKMYCSS